MAGRIRSIEKSSDLNGIQTHALPACSTVPELITLPYAPIITHIQVGDRIPDVCSYLLVE
jgi:hypothetical protein